MKKYLSFLSLFLLVSFISFAGGFSFRLNGGAIYLVGGDYNQAMDGWRAYVKSILQPSDTFVDNLKKLSWGGQFEGEILYEFISGFSVGISGGYMTASVKSGYQRNAYELMVSPSLSVIPLMANIHLLIPLCSALNLHMTAGAGVYITEVNYDYRETYSPSSQYSGTFKPKKENIFGAQAGIGFEIGLIKNIFLTIDVKGRYAEIGKLTGGWSGTYYGSPKSGDGTLWRYDYKGEYALIGIWEDAPSGVNYENVHEAKISMSGIIGLIGIRIAL